MNCNLISADVLLKMIEYFEKDAMRINHALKVYGFAGAIARSEKISEQDILIVDLAAVLHDIGIKEAVRKYNSSNGNYQEIEGPPIARELLAGLNLSDEIIDRICFIIGNHHSYQKIDGTDFQILVEADFLVNIFEEEMSESSIKSIRQKYFKTKAGIEIIESMYL